MWGCRLKNSVMALEHSPQGLQDRNQVMEHLVFGRKYLSLVNFSMKLISACLLVFWLVCRQMLCLPPQLISYSRQVSFRSSRGSKKTSNSWGSILLLKVGSTATGPVSELILLCLWTPSSGAYVAAMASASCVPDFILTPDQVCPQPPTIPGISSLSTPLDIISCSVQDILAEGQVQTL